jgi:subtilisin family serine protease
VTPNLGETWAHYKARVIETMAASREWLRSNAGLDVEPLVAANAFATRGEQGQLLEATRDESVRFVELDPPVVATCMDDAVRDIEVPLFRSRHPTLDGTGVRVAVLDSGIDTLHPWLRVSASISTCGESVDLPGAHGTHVAGSIASRDSIYPGIAPGVVLLNIKVLDSLGRGQTNYVASGVDAALDLEAHVLSMSLGFNHLPTWWQGGHGWSCPDGRCQLCTAVDNAVALDNVTVVVAAGNEHERAEALREAGSARLLDTELGCPGQARNSITVGALTKQTFLTASFSSRGPSAWGGEKPDIAAPGVNITSAFPAPRDAAGLALPGLTRGQLSEKISGTSMATPMVSGVVALIIQRRLISGESIAPVDVRRELLTGAFRHVNAPPREVGVGRVSLADL